MRRPKEADEESDEYRDSHHQLALSLSWLAIDIACLLTVCVLADLPSRQVNGCVGGHKKKERPTQSDG